MQAYRKYEVNMNETTNGYAIFGQEKLLVSQDFLLNSSHHCLENKDLCFRGSKFLPISSKEGKLIVSQHSLKLSIVSLKRRRFVSSQHTVLNYTICLWQRCSGNIQSFHRDDRSLCKAAALSVFCFWCPLSIVTMVISITNHEDILCCRWQELLCPKELEHTFKDISEVLKIPQHPRIAISDYWCGRTLKATQNIRAKQQLFLKTS